MNRIEWNKQKRRIIALKDTIKYPESDWEKISYFCPPQKVWIHL